ncbi:MAG TPA: hypothetical protein DDY29_05965 [Rhodobacteraceae bacterium]|jgi:hypothetical protein|nr:ABZJ_00895 family protein [Paracoccaceae bacterium]HBG98278.1 hypothetical protein [Paracoccaceae bacterium]
MPIKLWRFVVFYLGLSGLLAVVRFFVELPSGLGFVVVLFPALIEGQRFAESGQPRPPGGAIWRASVVMAALAAGIGGVLAIGLVLSGAVPELAAFDSWATVIAVILAIYFVVAILICRGFWGIGYSLGLRDMEKKRAKR